MAHYLVSRPLKKINESTEAFNLGQKQWEGLIETLTDLDNEITIIPGTASIEDFHIMAKHACMINNQVIVAMQKKQQAQASPFLCAALKENPKFGDYKIQHTRLHPDHNAPMWFNGGDVLRLDDTLLLGYGNHSAHEVANDLQNKTQLRVIDLMLSQANSQLMDALLIVNEGQALCHTNMLHPDSLAYLQELCAVTHISDDQACKATHTIMSEQTAIMSHNCYETEQALYDLGYEVQSIAFDYFQQQGYGPSALVLPVMHTAVHASP